MPLRKVREVRAWIDREAPSAAARQALRLFLQDVADESSISPSIPILELGEQPIYEVREAKLPVPGEDRLVWVWYRHFYATDDIDIIAVTNRWPP